MTDFDLRGTTAPTPAPEPAMTTIDALEAAKWMQLVDGTWYLEWEDHTTYANDDGDGQGNWECMLYQDDGDWIYDFEHCYRGGPQNNNGLDLDAGAPAEVAKAATKKALAHWIDRWTSSEVDAVYAATREAEDEDE